MNKIILSSRHYLNNANPTKLVVLHDFIQEYRKVASIYLDYLWEHGINFIHHKQEKTVHFSFDHKINLNCPSQLSTVELDQNLKLETTLTARARKCCITQVLGIIRGTIEKQRKRQYVANQKRAQRKKVPRKLRKALRHFKPVKPDISQLNPELNSVCFEFKEDSRHFNGWLKFHSFTNQERSKTIKLPISYHRHSNKLKKNGSLMNSFLLTEHYVDLRWEITPQSNEGDQVVGADQGKLTVLSLGDGQNTPDKDKHGHNLTTILKRMSRKKKGSKAFKKCQDHRKNFINWSINQLNFNHIKTLRLEDVKNLRYKSNKGRLMSHWTYTQIREKVERRCKLEEVLLEYNSSTFMSQRCHVCGLVLKSNRRGKVYTCKNCGYEGDADYNSACNHQQELTKLPIGLRKSGINRSGFLWKTEGLYFLNGEALTVPLSKKAG